MRQMSDSLPSANQIHDTEIRITKDMIENGESEDNEKINVELEFSYTYEGKEKKPCPKNPADLN